MEYVYSFIIIIVGIAGYGIHWLTKDDMPAHCSQEESYRQYHQ